MVFIHFGPNGQFYNSTGICTYPHLDTIWPNYSSTRLKQLLVKNFNFGLQPLWPKWPILQFYRNMHIPPLRHYLAKLQFYKNKTAPGQKFQFWSSSTLAKMDNSTILQEYAHTPQFQFWSSATLAKMASSTILQESAHIPS